MIFITRHRQSYSRVGSLVISLSAGHCEASNG